MNKEALKLLDEACVLYCPELGSKITARITNAKFRQLRDLLSAPSEPSAKHWRQAIFETYPQSAARMKFHGDHIEQRAIALRDADAKEGK